PIPTIRYAHDRDVYQLEAFASTDPALAEHAVVFVKFSVAEGTNNLVTVQPDAKGAVKFSAGKLLNDQGQVLAYFDKSWVWERQGMHAKIPAKRFATLAIPTKSLDGSTAFSFDTSTYDQQRKLCIETWQSILAGGMSVQVPEPYVNNAWRHLL